jgi:glutathione peroxidase
VCAYPVTRRNDYNCTRMTKLVGIFFLGCAIAMGGSVYDFTLKAIDGKPVPLSSFKGQVMLMVNVASQCGYTPQYEGLEKLYETYKNQGFVITGFPANNFGGQEPGTDAEIQTFCKSKYSVTFPMFSKISVKGSDQAPLYQFLTAKSTNPKAGGEIQWNFTKFLIDRNGNIVQRFEPAVEPLSKELTSAVQATVAKK